MSISKTYNCVIVSFFLISFLTLVGCKQNYSSATGTASISGAAEVDATSAACLEISRQLDKRKGLKGLTIQIVAENIKDKETSLVLPYSSVLRDGLIREISHLGANISTQETGANPYVLVGSYGKSNKMIIIDIKLRQYGDMASKDIASGQAAVLASHLEPHWLNPTFASAADYLVDQLSKGYMDTYFDLDIKKAFPGVEGKPALLLGKHFTAELQKAAAMSQNLPVSLTSSKKVFLKTSYVKTTTTIQFTSWLEGSDGAKLATATATMPLHRISTTLLQPDGLTVCTRYSQSSAEAPDKDSLEAKVLEGRVVEALRSLGIMAVTCTKSSGLQSQVVSSLVLPPVRSTRDGYQLATVMVEVNVLSHKGAAKGMYRKKATRPFKNNRSGATEKGIVKATGEELAQALKKALL